MTANGKPHKGDVESLAEPEQDPWNAIRHFKSGTPWEELSTAKKIWSVIWVTIRIILFLGFLYMFICSLDFLSSAFRLLGGAAAGDVLNDHFLLNNPVCGVMIGVLVTVLVQSSSTSTSIVVAMVSAGIIDVPQAIPVVMGANIGTSVTNTIVSMGQMKDRDEFRRSFGGATVHDMFNWLAVIVFLPIEVATHYLQKLTAVIVSKFNIPERDDLEVELLKVITKPFTDLIIKVDKKAITKIAGNEISRDEARLLKVCASGMAINGTDPEPCEYHHLFANSNLSDSAAGGIMLAVSLFVLCVCLFAIVKILHSLLAGSIAKIIHRYLNADFPGYAAYFTGYLAILIGAGMTFVVQSSSIFTSAITPLVGVGVISLDRMYPLTLGANIGTTATGIIAALASSGGKLNSAIQIALCHLFFNISGILVFYPLPFMRWPLPLARTLGNTTAKFRWFAPLYLALMFFLLPLLVIGLSLASPYALFALLPVALFLLIVIIINVLQNKKPHWLPAKLRTWNWMPIWCHSLRPYDSMMRCSCCPCYKSFCGEDEDEIDMIKTGNKEQEKPGDGHVNPAFNDTTSNTQI